MQVKADESGAVEGAKQAKKTLDEFAKEIREVNAANGWQLMQSHSWFHRYKVPRDARPCDFRS